MSEPLPTNFTTYGWYLCVWILSNTFQVILQRATKRPCLTFRFLKYGYHISVLNQIQAVLTCKEVTPTLDESVLRALPTCIAMSDFLFSAITAVFTVGGLVGSLLATGVMDRYGRKGAATMSAAFVAAGTASMGFAGSAGALAFGRFVFRPYASACLRGLSGFLLALVRVWDCVLPLFSWRRLHLSE